MGAVMPLFLQLPLIQATVCVQTVATAPIA
mgnify:CR=1 FL=1